MKLLGKSLTSAEVALMQKHTKPMVGIRRFMYLSDPFWGLLLTIEATLGLVGNYSAFAGVDTLIVIQVVYVVYLIGYVAMIGGMLISLGSTGPTYDTEYHAAFVSLTSSVINYPFFGVYATIGVAQRVITTWLLVWATSMVGEYRTGALIIVVAFLQMIAYDIRGAHTRFSLDTLMAQK